MRACVCVCMREREGERGKEREREKERRFWLKFHECKSPKPNIKYQIALSEEISFGETVIFFQK